MLNKAPFVLVPVEGEKEEEQSNDTCYSEKRS
jgi:hypothetical protein